MSASLRYLVLAGLMLVLIVCSERRLPAAGSSLITIYTQRDSTALVELVRSDHYRARRMLDTLLTEMVEAEAGQSHQRADSLGEALGWLCPAYTRLSGLSDKSRLLVARQSWTPDQCRLKMQIDSVFRIVQRDKPDQFALVHLRELRTQYAELQDTVGLTSVEYKMAELFAAVASEDSASAWLERCLRTAQEFDDLERAGNCELLRSRMYTLTDADYLQSEQALLRAAGYFERVGNYRHLASARIAQAYNATLLFQTERAIDGYRAGYVASAKYGDARQQAYCLYALGEAFYLEGALDSAELYAQRALIMRRQLAAKYPELVVDVACSESSIGLIDQVRGRSELAVRRYEEANRLLVRGLSTEMMCTNRLRLAFLLIARNDFDQASEYFRSIIDTSTMFENSITAQYGLAVCDYRRGATTAAMAGLRRCIHRQEISRSKLPIPSLTTGMLGDKLGYYRLLAVIFLEQYDRTKDPSWLDSAFTCVESSKAMALSDMLMDPESTPEEGVLADLIERLSICERDLMLHQGDSAVHEAAILALEDSVHAERIRTSRAGFGDSAADAAVHPDVGSIRRNVLDARTAVLSYLISEYGSYVFVLTHDRFAAFPLSASPARLDSSIHRYLTAISSFAAASEHDTLWKIDGRALYRSLIPAEALRDSGTKRLIVIADSPLCDLPFDVLIDDFNRYLAETFEVSYAPSAGTLDLESRRQSPGHLAGKTVVFANPLFADSSIAPLPSTRIEAQRVEVALGRDRVTIFEGDQATKSTFQRLVFERIGCLHIATHALCNERRPDRSALVFASDPNSPGANLLTRNEIIALGMPVDVVFLSTCQSATGRSYPGEGVLGLTQAFLAAGACAVVATYWSVDDRATADLVGYFYSDLSRGESAVHALAYAKRRMLSSERTMYHHPYFWASFVLMGSPPRTKTECSKLGLRD